MSIYKSPLCSCLICHKTQSSKGIHSHYHIAHTTKGLVRAQKNGRKGKEKSMESVHKIKNNKIKNYNLSPSTCAQCQFPLQYENRNNKFCSKSCSTSHLNTNRNFSYRKNKKYPRKCSVSFCQMCKTTIANKIVKYCTKCNTLKKQERGRISAIKRNFGGRTQSKSILYNGIYLGSTYELTVAKSLDENNIKWTKCKRFKYTDPFGKHRTYEPDFYLTDFDVYLDPKNDFLIEHVNPALGFKDLEKINIVEKTHHVRIIILTKDELSWEIIKQKIYLGVESNHGLLRVKQMFSH